MSQRHIKFGKMNWFISFLVIISVVKCEDFVALMRPFRSFKIGAFNALKSMIETEEHTKLLRSLNKLQPFVDSSVPFPCLLNNTKSETVPKNVNELRPGDIDVVAGIGDSLTAGVGLTATHPVHVAYENRGMGISAGGMGTWRDILTAPNVLKEFNPNLVGYATSSSLTLHKESQFNLGETGAYSEDMPYMARLLVKRMKTHDKVDVQNHWKVIGLSIGSNNFCSSICYSNNMTEVLENHKKDLYTVMRILKKHLPRSIVMIVPSPNLKLLVDYTGKSTQCRYNHILECPCLFQTDNRHREKYFQLMRDWQKIDFEMGNEPEFDVEDFTVVVQPFSMNFFVPNTPENLTDYTYLSEDCFHMSQKGNARIALSLWNNIMEPVGRKNLFPVEFGTPLKCPTEDHPYIYTRRNSVEK